MTEINWAKEQCPRRELHTPQPERWGLNVWAEQMLRTHRQTRCPGCGLYAVWQPRRDVPKLPPIEYRLDHSNCGCCEGDDTRCPCTFHAEELRGKPRRRLLAQTRAAGEG